MLEHLTTALLIPSKASCPSQEMDLRASSTSQSQLPDPSPPVSSLSLGVQLHVLSLLLLLFCSGPPASSGSVTLTPLPLQQLHRHLANTSLQEIAYKVLAKLGIFFLWLLGQGLSVGVCRFRRNCRSHILLLSYNSELAAWLLSGDVPISLQGNFHGSVVFWAKGDRRL